MWIRQVLTTRAAFFPKGSGLFLLAGVLGAPLCAILWLALGSSGGLWSHLSATVLPGYLWRTLALVGGVGFVSLLLGTTLAWVVTMFRFPGQRLFAWALLMPLAIPTYISAIVYVELLDYAGPVQTALRTWFHASDLPEVRSLPGAIFFISLVLYPYVYMAARVAFLQQASNIIKVARTLGRGMGSIFATVAVPLARPALMAGVLLVGMECMNDIGAVEQFGIRTLSSGIYDIWLGKRNIPGAAQVALLAVGIILLFLALERQARGKRTYNPQRGMTPPSPIRLRGHQAFAATTLCSLVVFLGFLLPVGRLGFYTLEAPWDNFTPLAINSLRLSFWAALLTTGIGFLLAYGARGVGGGRRLVGHLASMGYALPGAVLALGVFVPLAAFDNWLDGWSRTVLGVSTGLLLTGSLAALLYAYTARFLVIAYQKLEAGFTRTTQTLDMVAATLGCAPRQVLWRIHLPLARPTLLAAFLLVFMDCMKELPMTLLIRPFNLDTLATHVYTRASLGLVEESAPAALVIALCGLGVIILLNWALIRRGEE